MKKFTFKIFASLTIVFWSLMPTMAQTDYGTDVIVKNTSTENQRKPSLTVADNGWLYAGFTIGGGYVVYKSTNSGQTWANFHSYTDGTRTYDITKVIVCGAAPYTVFIANLYHTSSTAYTLYIGSYDGTTGGTISQPLLYSFTTDLYDFDIASDYKFPSYGSSPYGIGLLYAVHSSTDSITFVASTDGGVSFGNKRSVSTTGQWFGQVSLAYGRSWNYSNGRYCAAWLQRTGSTKRTGRIQFARNTSTLTSGFTTPVYVDWEGTVQGLCYNPKIACQFNDTDNDSSNVTTIVMFERAGYWANNDNDVIGYYNNRTFSGNNWYRFNIDNGDTKNSKHPDVSYDTYFNNFLATYWDSTNTNLPYLVHGFNITPTNQSTWSSLISHYNDNTTMGSLIQPYPIVRINDNLHQVAFLWSREGTSSNGVIMFDAEYSTVGISELITYSNDKISNIYPNPAYGVANIEIELNKSAMVQLNAYDIAGKKVSDLYNAQTPEGKNTVTFDVSNLENGNYVIEMITPTSRTTSKMMVAH